jgi:hypothetical protein
VPARHLYRFRNVAATSQYQPASLRNTSYFPSQNRTF